MTGRFYILEKIVGKQDVPGANQKIGVKAYFLALLSLVLIGFAIYCFHLEQDLGLVQLIPFVVGGFAIHALLPAGWRLPCSPSVSSATAGRWG